MNTYDLSAGSPRRRAFSPDPLPSFAVSFGLHVLIIGALL